MEFTNLPKENRLEVLWLIIEMFREENFLYEQIQIQTNPKCGRYSIEDEIWNMAYRIGLDAYEFAAWCESEKHVKFEVLTNQF